MANAEDFVKDQLPFSSWPVIPTVLRTAYAAVDEIFKDNPTFQVPSAQDNKGRFISYAVDAGLQRAVEIGSLACDFRWRPFALPTGRYLELRFSHSTASVSQVADGEHQPRNVVFRENARLRTQKAFDFPEFREEQRMTGLPHFLIVHGHQVPTFAHLGMPSAFSKTQWIWLSRNLMKMPHEIVSDVPAPENTETDFEELNLLKEGIEKWRRDNGDD